MIINLAPPELDPLVRGELSRMKLEPVATIPLDDEVYRYDLELKPLLDLPDGSPAVRAVSDLMARLLN